MDELKDGQVISLSLLTRRTFCKLSLSGLGIAVLPSCGGDPLERVSTGPLDPNIETGSDLQGGGPTTPGDVDMATSPGGGGPGSRDMATRGGGGPMSNCPGGIADTQTMPAAISMNTAVYVRSQGAFLCHDSGGYFALSSSCTHAGATLNNYNGQTFHCPRHGANFSYTGAVVSGPNGGPLDHYLLCLTANGTVGIDTGNVVSAAQRYAL